MVRSEGVGFLRDLRRLNVIDSRAKKCLIVVGNGETLKNDEGIKAWVEWLETKEVRSGMEWLNLQGVV